MIIIMLMMTMNTNKTKVLVVEDNPFNMELVFEILSAQDFTVHKAVDGEEAIKLAGNNSYDLVLYGHRASWNERYRSN